MVLPGITSSNPYLKVCLGDGVGVTQTETEWRDMGAGHGVLTSDSGRARSLGIAELGKANENVYREVQQGAVTA